MKFEDEIKSKGMQKHIVAMAILNTMYTGNLFQNAVIDVLKPYNVNDQHYNIMRILRGRHPECASPGEIKDVLVNKRGDLTRLLDKLCAMGLVHREYNSENRRKLDVRITQKGIDWLAETDPKVAEISFSNENLTEAEAKQLNKLLDKLRG